MKKHLKKGIAILAAGVLLTSSAAAYAAQLPDESAKAPLVSSSSEYSYNAEIKLIEYTMSSSRIVAKFNTSLYAEGSVQFRNVFYTYVVEQESSPNSSDFVTISEGNGYGFGGLTVDQAISVNPGQRIRIRVSASAPAFDGYEPIGSATDSEDFYFIFG